MAIKSPSTFIKKNQEWGVVSPAFEDRDRKFPAQAEWLDQQNWRTLALVKEFTLGNKSGHPSVKEDLSCQPLTST